MTTMTVVLIMTFLLGIGESARVLAANEPGARKMTKRDSEHNAEKTELLLVAGLQTVLDLNFKPCEPIAECVKVVNSQLATVQYAKEKRQLIFTPIKKGETTISVRDENGDLRLILKVIVSDNNLARAAREIKDLLKDIEGIEIRILGNKIVVDGEIIVPSDLNRVYAVLGDGAYKDLVLNLVTISPIGQKILAKRIQDEINNPKITVRVLNGTFILEGSVESANDAKRAEQILLNLMPDKVDFTVDVPNVQFKRPKKPPYINLIRVIEKKQSSPPKIVRLTLSFVELTKSYGRTFGFSWAPGIDNGGTISFGQSTTGGVTSQSNGALAGTISNLLPKLRSAQEAGYARVLQEVVLLTQSGVKGTVKRLKKIPIPVLDVKTGNTTYQAADTGLTLFVTPNVQGQDENVALKINFSFNALSGRLQTAPIIAVNTYEGTISVKSGDSAGVMNLVTNDIITDYNKDAPGQTAQAANPLFSLVRSKAFAKNKSQFVIFITPQIVENASVGTDDMKKRYGIKKR